MNNFTSDGLTLEYLEWHNPPSGDAVILLHGFPQPAEAWSTVADALADRGYRVIALRQRGYSPGAAPSDVRRYRLELLADDVRALLTHLGIGKAHIVGHDWGGCVAWTLAATSPELVETVTSVSMPHPAALPRALVSTFQPLRSWYIALFSIPRVPEAMVLNLRCVAYAWLSRTGLSQTIAKDYVDRLRSSPRTLRGAFNWYRAGLLNLPFILRMRPVTRPSLMIWSTEDVAVDRKAAMLTSKHIKGPYRFIELSGVSHWIPEQVPDKLAAIIHDHIGSSTSHRT